MKTTSVLSLAFAIGLSVVGSARADQPNGHYELYAGGYTPLWDLSGEYTISNSEIGDLDFIVTQDSNGKLTGSGYLDASSYFFGVNADLSGTCIVSGAISGSSANPSVALNLGIDASGDVNGIPIQSDSESIALKLGIDAGDGDLTGNGTVKATILYVNPRTDKTQRTSALQPIVEPDIALASGVDGLYWQLVLNLTPSGPNETGTAQIITSPGNTYNFTVSGVYASKTGKATLALDGSAGSLSLTITTTGSTLHIYKINGTLLGQKMLANIN